MLRRFRQPTIQTEMEEEAPVSHICVPASLKQDEELRRPRKNRSRRSQVDRVPSWPGAPKTPTRKASAPCLRTKPKENHRDSKSSTPTRNVHRKAESSTLLTPPPSPLRAPSATSSPKKAGLNTLPPPKSPLRLTLRRKATKPPQKTKSQMITEEVEEIYDENGTLQRTTVTRIRNSDGSSSTEKHRECFNPTSPHYRPKPKVNPKGILHTTLAKP
jgi:hypothetical protein